MSDTQREERVAPKEHRFAVPVGGPSGPPTWTATCRKWGIRASGSRGFVGVIGGERVGGRLGGRLVGAGRRAGGTGGPGGSSASRRHRSVQPRGGRSGRRSDETQDSRLRRVPAPGHGRFPEARPERRPGSGGGRVTGLRGVLCSNTVAGRNRRGLAIPPAGPSARRPRVVELRSGRALEFEPRGISLRIHDRDAAPATVEIIVLRQRVRHVGAVGCAGRRSVSAARSMGRGESARRGCGLVDLGWTGQVLGARCSARQYVGGRAEAGRGSREGGAHARALHSTSWQAWGRRPARCD